MPGHRTLNTAAWRRFRRQLIDQWRRAGEVRCHIGNHPIGPDEVIEVDHLEPASRRPDLIFDPANCRPACKSHNSAKRDRTAATSTPLCARDDRPVMTPPSRWWRFAPPATCVRDASAACTLACPARPEVDRFDRMRGTA